MIKGMTWDSILFVTCIGVMIMATIDSKKMIDELIANDGYYQDDPRVYMIVEYTNMFGNTTWGVTWVNSPDRDKYLVETEFVRNPTVIWGARV